MHEHLIEDKLSSIHLSLDMTQEIALEESFSDFAKEISKVTGIEWNIDIDENGQLLLTEIPKALDLQ